MASIPKPRYVSVDDKQVSISNFTTLDKDIHSYFANMSESDDMDKKFEHALKVGVVAARTIDTVGNVDYVEKEFNKLSVAIHQKMEEAFGENGQVSGIITENFGEDGQLLKEYLNPHKEGSPLQLTLKEIHTKIEDLKNVLGIDKGKEEEAKRGTQKGTKFEKYCEPLFAEIAKMHGDDVRPTGTEAGSMTDSKKGDFVYDIKELKKRISWEAKEYGSSLSKKTIDENLDLGIKNREADYGILVSKHVEALPRDYGWFKELTDKKLVIALGTENDEYMHTEILHIAYRWARSKLLQDTLQNGKFDPTFVQDKIKVLQEKLKKFKSIKLQCENIDDASNEIKDTATTLKEEIDVEFKEILESLK